MCHAWCVFVLGSRIDRREWSTLITRAYHDVILCILPPSDTSLKEYKEIIRNWNIWDSIAEVVYVEMFIFR